MIFGIGNDILVIIQQLINIFPRVKNNVTIQTIKHRNMSAIERFHYAKNNGMAEL